ncbi:MAG TPA: hypothetical protein VEZ16_17170 [Microvirga sp.]|nr:hypothetical protein [Microvirga sp.]
MSAVGAVKSSTNIVFGLLVLGRFIEAVREVLTDTAALRAKHRSQHPSLEW